MSDNEPDIDEFDEHGQRIIRGANTRGGTIRPFSDPAVARAAWEKSMESRKRNKAIRDANKPAAEAREGRRRFAAHLVSKDGMEEARKVLLGISEDDLGILAKAVALMTLSGVMEGKYDIRHGTEAMNVAKGAYAIASIEAGKLDNTQQGDDTLLAAVAKLRKSANERKLA